MLPSVATIRPIEAHGRQDSSTVLQRGSRRTSLAKSGLLSSIASHIKKYNGISLSTGFLPSSTRTSECSTIVRGNRHDRLLKQYQSTMPALVFSHADNTSSSQYAKTAAELVSKFLYAPSTSKNWALHLSKWFAYCNSQGILTLKSSDAGVISYIGFLSTNSRYRHSHFLTTFSALYRYHKHHVMPSPTQTQLVSDLRNAYGRMHDRKLSNSPVRLSYPATIMQNGVWAGCATDENQMIASSCAVGTEFILPLYFVSIASFFKEDLKVSYDTIQLFVRSRKGKNHRSSLVLKYFWNSQW